MTSVSLTVAIGEPANLYLPVDPTADMSVSAALNYLKLKPGSSVSISDTNLNIQKNLATLQTLNARITAVRSSENTKLLNVTYKEFQNDKGILAKWSNNPVHQFEFTDITAADAYQVYRKDSTFRMSIKDTAINIQNNLFNLISIDSEDSSKIKSVTQINTSALISLTASKFAEADNSPTNFLNKLNKGISNFAITEASVSDVVGSASSLGYKSSIKSIAIKDSTDAIDININALRGVGMKIKTISQNNLLEDSVLELTASEIKANSSVLGKIITGYQLAAQNTAASQLSSLLSNRKVISIDVNDTAINISRNWDSLNSYSNSINKIEVFIPPPTTAFPVPNNIINIKASQLANSKTLINKFLGPVNTTDSFRLNVSEASTSQVNDLLNSNEIYSFDIKDTTENISKNILEVFGGRSKINFVKTANSGQLEMTYYVYNNISSILGKINKGAYNLKLTDVSVEQLSSDLISGSQISNALFLDKSISSIDIADSTTNIEDNLSLFKAVGTRLNSISINYSIGSNDLPILTPLKLDAQDFLSNQRVLEKIVGGYKVDIEKATVKQALVLAANAHVQSIDIEDNSVNISSSWNKLIDINKELDVIKITGASVSITAEQFDQGIDASLQAKLLDPLNVSFAIKNASIDKAIDIMYGSYQSLISSIEIKDTGENIVDHFLDLKLLLAENAADSIDTKLFQLDPKNSLDVLFSDLTDYDSVLSTINGQGYKLTLNDASVAQALTATTPPNNTLIKYRHITSVNIVDTSVNVETNFNSLLSFGKKLSSISLYDRINDSSDALDNISLTYNQYITGKYVLDRIKDSYNLEINDAAVYNAASLSSNTHVKAVNVYGSASYITKAWDVLSGLGSKLKTIYNTTTTFSANDILGTSINLSITQWLNSSSLLSKFGASNKNFTLYDATVSDTRLILDDINQSSLIKNIKVKDNAESVDVAFDDNLAVLRNDLISDISLTNSAKPIELTFSQFNDTDNQKVFNKINKLSSTLNSNDFLLNITDALAENAILISNKSSTEESHTSYSKNIKLIFISDSSQEIEDNFDSLKSISKINKVALTTQNAELSLTATNVLQSDSISLLKKIVDDNAPETNSYLKHPYALNITDISMSQLEKLHPWDSSTDTQAQPDMFDSELLPLVRDYYLADSADNISTSFDKLTALGGNLKGFTFLDAGNTGDINISYNQWLSTKEHLDSLAVKPNTYFFNLSDVTAQDAVGGNVVASNGVIDTVSPPDPAVAVFDDTKVKSVIVKDNASAIAANWTLLNQEYEKTDSKLTSLIFTLPQDGPHTLELTASQVIKVNADASLQALFEQVTPTNPVIIRDSSTNISTYWDALSIVYGSGSGSLGSRLSAIELTDTLGVNLTESQLTVDTNKLIKDKLEGDYDSIKVDGASYTPPAGS